MWPRTDATEAERQFGPGGGSRRWSDAHTSIKLTWRIQPEDCKRAVWVHIRPRRSFAIVGCFLLFLAGFAIAAVLYQRPLTGKAIGLVLVLVSLLVYLAAYFFLLLPRRLTKLYRQQKLLHEEYTADVEEDTVVFRSARGEFRIPWQMFHKWKPDCALVLLYQSDGVFHVFPRRAFQSAADFDEFKGLLTRKLGAPAR